MSPARAATTAKQTRATRTPLRGPNTRRAYRLDRSSGLTCPGMRPLHLVHVVLIGACAGNDGVDVTTTSTTTTSTTATTTTTIPTTTTMSGPTVPDVARALVTPTGVVVSILEETA